MVYLDPNVVSFSYDMKILTNKRLACEQVDSVPLSHPCKGALPLLINGGLTQVLQDCLDRD